MMHGIGMALSEDYEDGETCKPCRSGFHILRSDSLHVEYVETPRPTGPQLLRLRRVFSNSPMCGINAIYNACGVRIYELPARPEN